MVSLSADAAERILKTAGDGSASPVAKGYEYRVAGSEGLPSAFAQAEPYGFYLCIYSKVGLSAEVLGFIVSAAATYSTVLVEEF